MNELNRISRALASVAALVALGACGGGGGDPAPSTAPSNATAEGVYGGTLAGSTSTGFRLLVLENGQYWALYGDTVANAFLVDGFIQGTGTSSNGSFTSADAKDFGVFPAVSGTVSATYDAQAKTISGTATSQAGSATFSGGPIPGSTYIYDSPAALSTIAGAWTLTTLAGESVSLNVGSNGAFTALIGGNCSATGTVTPRPSGKNVFNVAMTLGPAPCDLPGQSASGVALAYPLASGQTQLIVAVVDGTRTAGTATFGVR